jgi:hypothetical protein
MQAPDDDRLDEAILRTHDDVALEAVRFELARDGDHRLPQVVRVLAVRATPTIISVCGEVGAHRGVCAKNVDRAVNEALARLQMRLRRREHLPAVVTLAAGIARSCIDVQLADLPTAPKLAARAPDLRLIEGLRDGTVHPNDPEMS